MSRPKVGHQSLLQRVVQYVVAAGGPQTVRQIAAGVGKTIAAAPAAAAGRREKKVPCTDHDVLIEAGVRSLVRDAANDACDRGLLVRVGLGVYGPPPTDPPKLHEPDHPSERERSADE